MFGGVRGKMYFCIRLAASQQLKQASLRSICTIFAFEFNFKRLNEDDYGAGSKSF